MRERLREDNGSILMEMIMVIPIYFMLMGCVFFVGDFFLARSKLLDTERMYSWLYQFRHEPKPTGLLKKTAQETFFDNAKVGDQTLIDEKFKADEYQWSVANFSFSSLTASASSWVWGWVNLASERPLTGKTNDLTARTNRGDDFSSSTLMRTSFSEQAYRTWSGSALCRGEDWNRNVYRSPWPYKDSPHPTPSIPVEIESIDYERFKTYVQWSL